MSRRTLKQLIYGAFYLAILFLIVYGIYLSGFKAAPSCFDGKKNQKEEGIDCGGSCPPCALKLQKPIKVLPVRVFPVDKTTSALIELRNPNTNLGADKFDYELNFYDANGEKIFSLTKDSFIYPGEIKYIAEINLDVDYEKIDRTEFKISGESWVLANEFPSPKVSTREVTTEFDSAKKQIVASGILVNENPFDLSRASVSAILVNTLGVEIGISETLVTDIKSFEERVFKIVLPTTDKLDFDPRETKIFVEARR